MKRYMATPIQSQPQQEKLWETVLSGILAMIILPALIYVVLLMLTQQSRPSKSDVSIVDLQARQECEVWPVEYGSNKQPRYKCRHLSRNEWRSQ